MRLRGPVALLERWRTAIATSSTPVQRRYLRRRSRKLSAPRRLRFSHQSPDGLRTVRPATGLGWTRPLELSRAPQVASRHTSTGRCPQRDCDIPVRVPDGRRSRKRQPWNFSAPPQALPCAPVGRSVARTRIEPSVPRAGSMPTLHASATQGSSPRPLDSAPRARRQSAATTATCGPRVVTRPRATGRTVTARRDSRIPRIHAISSDRVPRTHAARRPISYRSGAAASRKEDSCRGVND